MISTPAVRPAQRASARLSDAALAAIVGVVLFVAAAWPILFLDVAPYQDLPGHLATVTILRHPELYPEFVSNGFFKTNSALIGFVSVAGGALGIKLAAKLFILATLAAMAFVLPRFVLQMTDRRRMLIASVFMLPMVHNWWVSMGMLNFSLGIALALEVVVQIDRQRIRPSVARGLGIALLSFVAWYAHAFPLLVVGLAVVVHVATRGALRECVRAAKALLVPLVPVGLLILLVIANHARETGGSRLGVVDEVSWEPPLWVAYDLWAKWWYGFTPLSVTGLVLAVVLAALSLGRWRQGERFFPWGLAAALVAACWLVPYQLPGFGYVNMRFLPFVWMAALVRVPDRLPRWLMAGLAASAVLYAAGMSVDLFRVDRDTRAFAAGMDAVPLRARLLTLNFREKVTSENTWSLHTASGLYVVEKLTSAQDVWADSPTMPIMHASPPDFFADAVRIRRFVAASATPASFCAAHEANEGLSPLRCEDAWRSAWADVWAGAEKRFDRVLLWGATDEVLSTVPPTFAVVFDRGALRILAPPAKNDG